MTHNGAAADDKTAAQAILVPSQAGPEHHPVMAAITRFVLRHRLIVGVLWLIVTIVAIFSASSAIGALSQDNRVPGEGRRPVRTSSKRTATGARYHRLFPW